MSVPSVGQLRTRFEVLSKKYLEMEIQKELTSELPDTDNIAAFRLLMHAELEEFFERTARGMLEQREAVLAAAQYFRSDADFILLLAHDIDVKRSDGMRGQFDDDALRMATMAAIAAAKKRLADNNGIKRDSMALIAVCCGLMPDGFDLTLINTLHSYGADRGDVAHKSASRARTIRSPSNERQTVSSIIDQVELHVPWRVDAPSDGRAPLWAKLVATLRQLLLKKSIKMPGMSRRRPSNPGP